MAPKSFSMRTFNLNEFNRGTFTNTLKAGLPGTITDVSMFSHVNTKIQTAF